MYTLHHTPFFDLVAIETMDVVQSPVPAEPILGSLYQVEMSDGAWHVAEIIQKRNNPETKITEYYIHYKECMCPF